VLEGNFEQGGWLRGTAPTGTTGLRLGDETVQFDSQRRFFAAFDRDAPAGLKLTATRSSGGPVTRTIAIAPRDWRIERVNVPLRGSMPSEAFMAIRRPELAAIDAARSVRSDTDGWRQRFVWPVKARISGRFGSQRIYQGVPGSYHSGLDIAPGADVPYVAPADGVVVLAASKPFTLEGNLVIIDHGMGLNSAFLHSSRLTVKEGDRVKQGQVIGYTGATGRATGPHLHWSLKWQDARLDPLLFLPQQ
jgi:murein DD-endopeptidase MepM/ murein hydrolase activator NlpD